VAPGGDGVPTRGPWRGKKETNKWDPTTENSRIKNTPETKIAHK
jgi:hypothetical protein